MTVLITGGMAYVDGALLVDLWDDLVLPRVALDRSGRRGRR